MPQAHGTNNPEINCIYHMSFTFTLLSNPHLQTRIKKALPNFTTEEAELGLVFMDT